MKGKGICHINFVIPFFDSSYLKRRRWIDKKFGRVFITDHFEASSDYYDYVILERRTLMEILFDFKVTKLSPQLFFFYCRRIANRKYSIIIPNQLNDSSFSIIYSLVEHNTPTKSYFKRKNFWIMLFIFKSTKER